MASLSARLAALASPFRWRQALNCAPAIALLLGGGVALGRPLEAAIAAGAAFSVGFGAYRRLGGRPWLAMSIAMAAMSASAFAGSLLGLAPLAFALASAVLAAVVAWFALYEENLWWICLETVIAFLVAGHFAGPPETAAHRALWVAIGGTIQVLTVGFLRERGGPAAAPAPTPVRPALFQAHAVRAAVSVGLATLAAARLGLGNGYWAPMTALIVLKPGLRETSVRGVFRLAGTVGGCAAASLFALAFPQTPLVLMAAVLAAAWLSYALQRANYALFSAAVSATVVFFLAAGHVPEAVSAGHRVVATVIGGAIALGVAYLGRRPPGLRPASRSAT